MWTALTAGITSALVPLATDKREYRVIRLFCGWFSRSVAIAAKRLALPNNIAALILLPMGLWAFLAEPAFLTPQMEIGAALIVFICA